MTDELPYYLFIDPGDMSGWAKFSATGDILTMGQYHLTDQTDSLRTLITPECIKVVCEDYRNHAWNSKAKMAWSRNQTSKNIGKIELYAELIGVPIELVPNTNKEMGYMFMGRKAPTNHAISHQYDATAHGVFWLQSEGINPPGKFMNEKEK